MFEWWQIILKIVNKQRKIHTKSEKNCLLSNINYNYNYRVKKCTDKELKEYAFQKKLLMKNVKLRPTLLILSGIDCLIHSLDMSVSFNNFKGVVFELAK